MLPALCAISLLLSSHAIVPDYFAIQDAFHSGELDPAEFAELLVQAMTEPETIPSSYLTERQGRGVCLTTIFMGAVEAARHDPEATNVLDRVRFRPAKQYSFVSPDGHFTIHYDTSGDHAVYQPDVDLDPADGIPDYVNRCAEIFDLCWHVEVDSMGFYPPGSDNGLGGSDNYDVYLHHYGAYGVTFPEGIASEYPDWTAYYSHIFVDPTYSGFGYSDRLLPLKVTAAHEFHHACQFSYRLYNASSGRAWMEHCAVWMEDKVYDGINDYLLYLPYFFDNPHVKLYDFYAADGFFPYGACIWPHFLDHKFGADTIRRIWDECINSQPTQAVDIALQNMGSSRSEAASEFRVWNYFTSDRDDGQHYEEGNSWPRARLMKDHADLPVLDGAPVSGQTPGSLACNYLRFLNVDRIDSLRVSFSGQTLRDWAANFILLGAGIQEFASIGLTDGEGTAVLDLQGAATVVMIPTCLSLASGDYTYWARDAHELATLDQFRTEDASGDGRLSASESFGLGASFVSIAAEWETPTMIVRSLDPDLAVLDSIAVAGAVGPGGTMEFTTEQTTLAIISSMEPHFASLRLLIGPSEEELLNSFDIQLLLGVPNILIIDDDGGNEIQTFVEATMDSLAFVYDVWDDQTGAFPDFPQAGIDLDDYELVVWLTGDAGNSLDGPDLQRAVYLLENDTHLLLSGQDIAESLAVTQEGLEFLDQWLGISFDGFENRQGVLGHENDPLFADMSFATSGYGMDGASNQTSRDRLLPGPDVDVCLDYQTGYPAAIRRDFGSSRLIFCGFGVEAIVDNNTNVDRRMDFLAIAIDYLENGITDIGDLPIPEKIVVMDVWPNPASGSIKTRLMIPNCSDRFSISLVDLAGRHIVTLLDGIEETAGETIINLKLPDSVRNGFYLLNFHHADTKQTVPVTILR